MFHEELFTRSQCHCCQQEVTGLGIECAECANVRLCAECFSLGAEIGSHKADHRYRFFDSGSLRIFADSDWSAREEIRLLDAIEQYGFGNWHDISKHIETKNPVESKEEYVKRFVQGVTGQVTWTNVKEKVQRPTDRTTIDEGPLSPSLTQKLPPLEILPDEMGQLGYMPQRDDYEKEFDNDAEKLVSQLVFSPEDEEIDIALKLALVDMYARRLRERARRKRVIRDYQLVNQFFKKDKPTPKRPFSAYEKELQERFKSFAQFHSAREHELFIQNLVKEKELKFRLQECYKYRRNGITRAEECVEYERMRSRKRSLQQNADGTPNENGALPVITEAADRPNSEDSVPTQASQVMQVVQTSKVQTRPRTPTMSGEKRSADESSCQGKRRTVKRSLCDDFSSSSEVSQSEAPSSQATVPQLRTLPSRAEAGVVRNSSLLPTDDGPKDTAGRFTANVNSLPSSQLLTHPEKKLCVSTHILPAQYLTIKTAVLMNKPTSRCTLGRPDNMSDTEWTEIVNFMVKSGWMSSSIAASKAE